MKVLIGITTYNRASILPKAIESALAQDYPDKEVVVFDDASTDDTPKLQAKFPQVKWFREEKNQGCLFARNFLMKETNADFYFSLDDDAWFLQGNEISQGVNILKEHLNVAALAYDILSPDNPTSQTINNPYPTSTFIGCGHLLRLSAVKEVDYYTPNPGFYGGEEKDLSMRLLDQNYEIWYLPGIHVWHDKTLLERDIPAQHRSGVCNDLVFAFRRCPIPMLLWLLPAKILSHLRFSLSYNLLQPCIAGIYKFFSIIPSLISTRNPVKEATFQEFRKRSRITPINN